MYTDNYYKKYPYYAHRAKRTLKLASHKKQPTLVSTHLMECEGLTY